MGGGGWESVLIQTPVRVWPFPERSVIWGLPAGEETATSLAQELSSRLDPSEALCQQAQPSSTFQV